MKISYFLCGGGAMPRRRFALHALLLSGTCTIWGSHAFAQNANPMPAGVVSLPAPLASAPKISVLVIAFDSLPDPNAPVAAIPILPAAPAPPQAIVPAPGITPARLQMGGLNPFWLANAQKTKKNKEDDLFRLEPDAGALLPNGQTQPVAPAAAPITPPTPVDNGLAPLPTLPPGRAQLVSLPIRRNLLALGWGDVLTSAPDGTAILRGLGERRFTTRTLDNLKIALAQIAAAGAAPSAAALKNATLQASRIGQALGYRAVVALAVSPTTPENGMQNASFSLLLADSGRESGEPILFDEKGADENSLREAGASTAAALLDKSLRGWPENVTTDRASLAQKHLDAAHAAIAANDSATAQDELNQVISLDPLRGESYVLLGDLLAPTDVVGAASAYRRAVQLNDHDGDTWAKIAVSATLGTIPDWPRALDAGRRALAAGTDTVPLRVAMATAQFGRADLFRKADRLDRAEDAEFDARQHLDRALELAPDDPNAVRLLAKKLVESRRFSEATQTLDRVAPRYPKDIEIQTQYAIALAGQGGREEDAFVAYARVWRLSGQKYVDVDGPTYRTLAQGFDLRIYNIGKSAMQLTTGVAKAALPREEALLQMTKLQEDMTNAQNGINILRAPISVAAEGATSRVFAANLMNQSLDWQQRYLETGQDDARLRGLQLNVQAVAQLNAARGGA